jgi:hypothetical protein
MRLKYLELWVFRVMGVTKVKDLGALRYLLFQQPLNIRDNVTGSFTAIEGVTLF